MYVSLIIFIVYTQSMEQIVLYGISIKANERPQPVISKKWLLNDMVPEAKMTNKIASQLVIYK